MIYVIGPNYPVPDGANVINTTSRSLTWSRGLSPFLCGPVDLYDGYKSYNVENAWQYSKVHYNMVDENLNPTKEYFEWAQKGWNTIKAHRYPMGKGVKPLFAYWDGEKLDYIESRKRIYIPLYSQAVQKTFAFQQLKKIAAEPEDLYLWDFDGYNHKNLGLSYEQVINDPDHTMGHGFVIAMLLEGYL
jgi:hypothetical protein